MIPGKYTKIRTTLSHRAYERSCRWVSSTILSRGLIIANSILSLAIEVIVGTKSWLSKGFKYIFIDWSFVSSYSNIQGTILNMVFIWKVFIILWLLKIFKALLITPIPISKWFPFIEVTRLASHVYHCIYWWSSSKGFSTGLIKFLGSRCSCKFFKSLILEIPIETFHPWLSNLGHDT